MPISEYMGGPIGNARARGYDGDLRHNVKAVYQFYLGAYDRNPANLNPLLPQESAKRYLELMGGADENAVLHHKKGAPAADANATLTLTKDIFIKMMAGMAGAKDMLFNDDVKVSGSKVDLVRFFTLIDKASGTFAIVTK